MYEMGNTEFLCVGVGPVVSLLGVRWRGWNYIYGHCKVAGVLGHDVRGHSQVKIYTHLHTYKLLSSSKGWSAMMKRIESMWLSYSGIVVLVDSWSYVVIMSRNMGACMQCRYLSGCTHGGVRFLLLGMSIMQLRRRGCMPRWGGP